MMRIIFDDIEDLAVALVDRYYDDADSVAAICNYDIAAVLIKALLQHDDLYVGSFDISDVWNDYDKEYIVSVYNDCVTCEPAYRNGGYLGIGEDVVYVHQDCNSKVLKRIDTHAVYEFAIAELDFDDYDDDVCDGCDDDCITAFQSTSVTVSKDKSGRLTGFTKSWTTTNEDGLYQYNSYTYHCSDEDMLRGFAQRLDIDL